MAVGYDAPGGVYSEKKVRRDLMTLKHSSTVARAARLIASRVKDLDAEEMARWGLFHDIGKLYIRPEQAYKHPRKGFEVMAMEEKTALPLACLLHPFPDLKNEEFINFFFKEDEEEIVSWRRIVAECPRDLLEGKGIQLIQLCDKLSGIDQFVTLEEKFAWYAKDATPPPFVAAQEEAYRELKAKFDNDIQGDIYELLGIAA